MNKKSFFITTFYVLLTYCVLASVFLIIYCNPNYKEKEEVKINETTLKVNNSYLTSYNEKNQVISNDQTFLLIDLDTNINYDELFLKLGNKYYKNNNEYLSNFVDFKNNLLVYLIDNDKLNENKYLYYRNNEKMITRNYKVLLKPIDLNTKKEVINQKMSDHLKINNIDVSILDYSIEDTFIDTYQENNNNINIITNKENSKILKLHISNLDNIKELVNYIKIKYMINNNEYESMINLENYKIINRNLYFSVDKKIEEANKIWIEYTDREYIYYYYLLT